MRLKGEVAEQRKRQQEDQRQQRARGNWAELKARSVVSLNHGLDPSGISSRLDSTGLELSDTDWHPAGADSVSQKEGGALFGQKVKHITLYEQRGDYDRAREISLNS